MKSKYDYRRIGNHVFRIRFDRTQDGIRYEIQAPANLPRNFFEKIIQFFTVESYHFGYWFPWHEDTLDERVTRMMSAVVEGWEAQNNMEKTWANL